MLRLVRSVCLICFALLAAALAIAIVEMFAPGVILRVAGCVRNDDVLPTFACPAGALQIPAEMILNFPIMFIVAPIVTLFGPIVFDPTSMTLFYVFDVIVVLALAHPVLALLAGRPAKAAK